MAAPEEKTTVPNVAVEWNEETVRDLGIQFEEVADNTSEFTRFDIKTPEPRRYFDVKMTFSWNGQIGGFLRADDAVIPYVPPKDSSRSSRRGAPPTNNYGKGYVYVCLPRVLLDRIVNKAATHGHMVALGEEKIQSTKKDWWITLNLSKKARIRMSRKKGDKPTDTSIACIFMSSKMGVTANVIMSIKLKCSVPEATRDDGTYYDWNEMDSPPRPDESTMWYISYSTAEIRITNVGIKVQPPVINYTFTKQKALEFVLTDADEASEIRNVCNFRGLGSL
ncbi:hypothetical protein BDV19DRAFT_384698 [Aspergillus venezuelensis]